MEDKNERFKRIAGSQIYNNLPMNLLEDFKIFYNNIKEIDGEKVKTPLLTEDSRRRIEVVIKIDGTEYRGQTACSKKDNFCKIQGRKIALIRACQAFWNSNYVINNTVGMV